MRTANRGFYNSGTWRAFRAAYLERHPICAVEGCKRDATHVDHKTRRPLGPDYPPDSGLDGLCSQHHNRKSRVHDQTHKPGEYQHTLPGCDARGLPIDPKHHWKTT